MGVLQVGADVEIGIVPQDLDVGVSRERQRSDWFRASFLDVDKGFAPHGRVPGGARHDSIDGRGGRRAVARVRRRMEKAHSGRGGENILRGTQ